MGSLSNVPERAWGASNAPWDMPDAIPAQCDECLEELPHDHDHGYDSVCLSCQVAYHGPRNEWSQRLIDAARKMGLPHPPEPNE